MNGEASESEAFRRSATKSQAKGLAARVKNLANKSLILSSSRAPRAPKHRTVPISKPLIMRSSMIQTRAKGRNNTVCVC